MALQRRRRYKFLGRFNALPTATTARTAGQLIAPGARRGERTMLKIYNQGTGNAYISDNQQVGSVDDTIPSGAVFNFDLEATPQNAIYAVGDPGHDLRVSEVVYDNTPDNTGW